MGKRENWTWDAGSEAGLPCGLQEGKNSPLPLKGNNSMWFCAPSGFGFCFISFSAGFSIKAGYLWVPDVSLAAVVWPSTSVLMCWYEPRCLSASRVVELSYFCLCLHEFYQQKCWAQGGLSPPSPPAAYRLSTPQGELLPLRCVRETGLTKHTVFPGAAVFSGFSSACYSVLSQLLITNGFGWFKTKD